jgi:hypothetical protein
MPIATAIAIAICQRAERYEGRGAAEKNITTCICACARSPKKSTRTYVLFKLFFLDSFFSTAAFLEEVRIFFLMKSYLGFGCFSTRGVRKHGGGGGGGWDFFCY